LLKADFAPCGYASNLLKVSPEEALSHPGITVVHDAAVHRLWGFCALFVQEFAVALKHPAVAFEEISIRTLQDFKKGIEINGDGIFLWSNPVVQVESVAFVRELLLDLLAPELHVGVFADG
jgi:hypothetical protein